MNEPDNLNLICDQFEDVYLAGQTPQIAGFMERVAPEQKSALLSMLLPVDIEFNIMRKAVVSADNYSSLGREAVELAEKIIAAKPKVAPLSQGNPEGNRSAPTDPLKSIRIGNYKLLQKIGEGGMGEVWMAEQIQPVRRKVALKLIRQGTNDRNTVTRFEAERQALAMMDHPCITKVFDAGTTADGLPFFAMELVTGTSITKFCDSNRFDMRQRLELFVQVCNAVQHAHQKGLIHRDLKPGNILVSFHDSVALPKIIDFGLAKSHQNGIRLTDKTMFTEYGQVLGTVQYMSPEQAVLDVLDVDTRSDIYSLGVILYELLVGSTPIQRDAMQQKKDTLLKVLANVREQQPPEPSNRLSQSGDRIFTIGNNRKILPRKLQQLLKGDLDWIVMKALEKERNRRYETASEFAADVQRYLDGEEVIARPPSTGYKFKKFAQRNRKFVLAGVFAFTLMTCAAAVSGWFAIRENRARDRAEQASHESAVSAKRSEDVLAFVTRAFESTRPLAGGTHDMTASEVLEKARKLLDDSELDDLGKADVLDSLTSSFLGIGKLNSALETAKQALPLRRELQPPGHQDISNSMMLLARCYSKLQQTDDALALLTKAYDQAVQQNGVDDPLVHDIMMSLAKNRLRNGQNIEARNLAQQVVDFRKKTLGLGDAKTIAAIGNLANCYDIARMNQKALELRKQTRDLALKAFGPNHSSTVSAISNLANSLHMTGQTEEALRLRKQVLEQRTKILGPSHPETLRSMHNLAVSYQFEKRFAEEVAIKEKAYSEWVKLLGEDHPKTLATRKSLAISYANVGNYSTSIEIYNDIYLTFLKRSGSEHAETLVALNSLVWARTSLPLNFEPSEELRDMVQQLQTASNRRPSGGLFNTLAVAQFRFKNYELAIEAALKSSKMLPAEYDLPCSHPADLAVLAISYHRLGEHEKSAAAYRQLLAAMNHTSFKDDAECKSFAAEANLISSHKVLDPNTDGEE